MRCKHKPEVRTDMGRIAAAQLIMTRKARAAAHAATPSSLRNFGECSFYRNDSLRAQAKRMRQLKLP